MATASPSPSATPSLRARSTWNSLIKDVNSTRPSKGRRLLSLFRTQSTDDNSPPPPPYSATEPVEGEGEGMENLDIVRIDEKATLLTDPATHPEEEKFLCGLTAFLDVQGPIPSDLPPLPKPIAIPRLHPGPTFPFARAWPAELERQAITQADWLAFIDNINTISFPHPVVSVLELASFGVGFIPLDEANGISAGLDIIAFCVAWAIASARCRRFLDRANAALFHPRGLHARILGTKAMRRALAVPADAHLTAPLSADVATMSALGRLLAGTRTWSCEVDTEDVPPPEARALHARALAKAAAFRINHKVRSADRRFRGARKRAWKRHNKGKKVSKLEGADERFRAKLLSWIVVQNLDEFEKQEQEAAEEKQRKKAERTWRGLPFRERKSAKLADENQDASAKSEKTEIAVKDPDDKDNTGHHTLPEKENLDIEEK